MRSVYPFSIRIEAEYLEKLSWLARREHRSVNRQIEWALAQYLLGYEAANGPISPADPAKPIKKSPRQNRRDFL